MKLSLNFISPSQEKNLKFGYLCFIIKDFLGVILVLSVLLAIMAIPLNIKNEKLEKASKVAEELSAKSALENASKIKLLEQKTQTLAKIAGKYYDWTMILNKLSELVPNGVVISKFSADQKGFSLAGTADTRNNFLLFQKNLNESAIFKNIDSPLENYIKETDLVFELKGKIVQ